MSSYIDEKYASREWAYELRPGGRGICYLQNIGLNHETDEWEGITVENHTEYTFCVRTKPDNTGIMIIPAEET